MNKQEAQEELKLLKIKEKELNDIINKPKNLFKDCKTYSAVCLELGEQEITKSDFVEELGEELILKLVKIARIKQIGKLFNGDWIIDWENLNQYKYYPYFKKTPSGGWLFVSSAYRSSLSYGQVAFFKDQKTSDFIGTNFKEYFID